ncbi:MAG: GDYXXLXY domain-containing protein [Bacteroidia bacterium]
MNSKKIIMIVFVMVALVQIYVPAKMIMDRENVLRTGTEYKFRTAPVDPSDPFRGKYITLNFAENTVGVQNEDDWVSGESVYLSLKTDEEGFVKINSVSKEKPDESEDFLKAKVWFVSGDTTNILTVQYPFDRYYMEESKAYPAELAYIDSQQNDSLETYALVRIKNGEAVLKDVLIDGISINEIVKAQQEE